MGVTILQTAVRRRWVWAASILAVLTTACTAADSHVSVGAPTTTTTPPPPPAGDAVIAPPPEKFEGAPAVRRPPPPQLSQRATPGPGTWAVIVGVNDYPGTAHDLRSAVADAEDIDTALAGMGVPADHRLVLKDGQVTREVLRSAAQWLTRVAGPDAVAVFAFAGHVRKRGATESMVTADGRTVTDAELASILGGLQARRVWVVMAACYGGGFTEVLRPGVVLTGAAPADKEAFENLDLGNSYLVEFMVIQGMIEGRAPETVQSAFEYARRELSLRFPDRVPEQFDHAGGPLDLRPPGAPRPAPSARWVAAPNGTGAGSTGSDNAQGNGGGGSGTGTTTTSSSSSTTTTAPPPDKCKGLTAGVITCSSSR